MAASVVVKISFIVRKAPIKKDAGRDKSFVYSPEEQAHVGTETVCEFQRGAKRKNADGWCAIQPPSFLNGRAARETCLHVEPLASN